MRSKARAFTLVELLVVIGIIALLIGILLPALNKARQQANLISCGSRLHQIGLTLSIYESQNKGAIPLGEIDEVTIPPAPALQEKRWYWTFALGDLMTRNMVSPTDGYVHGLSKVFADVDTVDNANLAKTYWTSHYMCNPRVFHTPLMYSHYDGIVAGVPVYPTDGQYHPLSVNRKITDIKNTSDVFGVWDAPQQTDRGYNSYPVAQTIDDYGFYGDELSYLTEYYGDIDVGLPVYPGTGAAGGDGLGDGIGDGSALQKQYNNDGPNDFGVGIGLISLRFRHVNNTKLSALCMDGHVETRAVGRVVRKDIYTNVPSYQVHVKN